MEESLHILKEIGAQKIHKDTHISKESVQAIIHGSFDGLNSVQLMGFISILEKEYAIDLSEFKKKAKEHFGEIDGKNPEIKKVFVTPQKQKNNAPMYIIFALLIFFGAAYYSFAYLSSMSATEQVVDNSQIESAQKIATQEFNETKVVEEIEELETLVEANVTEAIDEEVKVETEVEEVIEEVLEEQVKTLKILPKNKIWAGYINIKTNQKYQKVFRKEFAIDVNKDWLLLFGSGTVHLEVNGEKQKYSSNQNMRFKYVDGVFTKITVTEFKKLNKGRKW